MDAEAVRQLGMVIGCVFMIRGDAGSHHIIRWIILYRQLDRIVLAGSGNTGFYELAGYWLDGADGMDGVLVGRGWDGPTLAPVGTGAPPLAL